MNREKLPEYIFKMFPVINKKLLKRRPESVVSKQQMNLMHTIKFHPDKTMSEYCEKTMISKPNLTKLVNSLIEEDYVTRTRDQQDRRKVTLQLSKKGDEMVAEFFKSMGKQIIESTKNLTDEEVDQLIESFETIHRLFDKLESSDVERTEAH